MRKKSSWKKCPSVLSSVFLITIAFCSCSSSSNLGKEDSGGYYVITESQILAALQKRPLQNAFEIIEFLRPRYLRPRTQQSVSRGAIRAEPVVYLNDVRFGTINELINISYHEVKEVKYLKSTEATQRFGMGHEGGAILISRK